MEESTSTTYSPTVESDSSFRMVHFHTEIYTHDIQSSVFECDLHHFSDVPGTDCRIATISGTHEGCQRAKKWVDDLIAEVSTITHTPCKNSIM